MVFSWGKIFKYYDGITKLEKVKKKIYFFFSVFFSLLYIYYIVSANFANEFDFWLLIFSLFFNLVAFFGILFLKSTKLPVIVSSLNDITNTSLAIWFTGGLYSFDVYWYFTLIIGLVVLVETRIGLIVSFVALINIMVVLYADYHQFIDFKSDANAISMEAKMINLLSVFVVMIFIIWFVTKKDLFEEEIIQEKDTNIFNLEAKLDQKLNEINNIRKEIAKDFHDEMGNKLASITVLSQTIGMKIKNNETKETSDMLETIEKRSIELYQGTKDFIWSIDVKSDMVYEFFLYLREFGEVFFNELDIDFTSKNNFTENELIKLPQNTSRQLIYVVKEIFTNAAKHAQCNKVDFDFELDEFESKLKIIIKDNGRGLDLEKKFTRGIANVKQRVKKMNAALEITSKQNTYTLFYIEIPLN